MKLLSLMLLCALVPAMPAFAADAPSDQAPDAAPDKKICRKEANTGSIMTRRVCHTRAEWDAIAQSANAEQDRAGTRSMSGNWHGN